MKTFLIFLTFLLLFSGCSQKNAFSRFGMTQMQELSAESLQRSKMKFEDKVNGTVSIVYLNMVSPEVYSEDEYFYINVYLKNKNYDSHFLLNEQEAINIEELPPLNDFTELTSVSNEWSKYYLVRFPKQGDKLSFVFENGPYSSDPLEFEKDE